LGQPTVKISAFARKNRHGQMATRKMRHIMASA